MFGFSDDTETNEILEAYPYLKHLPHGSGIDGDYSIEIRDGVLTLSNGYHAMDEVGMYCGWLDYTVEINLTTHSLSIECGASGVECYTLDDDGESIDDSEYKTEHIVEYLYDEYSLFVDEYIRRDKHALDYQTE